ncbi:MULTISPECIES: type II secretion system F family protein [unclassified Bradyrhizobium]|uniref:type II secretion system F family protein n=1 Tax=unclassified Bradyrhizobium TaxID=2631580 RepID=UPI00247A0C64|nr:MULTISPECIES: type II secretion system F family protein [unclassified Bradyrhizobium]WGS18102.1 type II secretion system F family protein [Bradyrhizobium sp. ISRA463]WGS24916.1 type II secretion system F family protein [Bradyrhizobium sp. ISRA464]
MPNFRYRALTQNGEIVNGTISAPTLAEVARRIEYLRLLPIETIEDKRSPSGVTAYGLFGRPSAAEITTFTRDLALLLKAGARLDDALELLAGDADVGRLRPVVAKLRASLLTGESLADAIAGHPALFSPMYAALVRVGEVSGTLDQVLEMLGAERARSEQMRRKLTDAMQYPAFVLVASACVMLFFILFVLPQFSSVLQDFGSKSDTTLGAFIKLSEFLRANATPAMLISAATIAGGWALLRRPGTRAALMSGLSRLPGVSGIFQFYRSSLFCRNLGVLLGSGVNLTSTLRILVDIMAVTGNEQSWSVAADRVRHGGKLSDALAVANSLPPMALRMLRLGEETGQLPTLASRVAEFYEAKLQRSLDRIVGIVGPLAIISISTVVGGLIVSVMTALLSVTQLVN